MQCPLISYLIISFFSLVYAVVKQIPVLVFHTTQIACYVIRVKLATILLLTRCSNQLNSAAVQNYHYLLYKLTVFDKSVESNLSLRTCIKSLQFSKNPCRNLAFFTEKYQKTRSAAEYYARFFSFYSHTALLKKRQKSKLHGF